MNQLEEFGLAVKAEPIEGERSNEQECLLGDGWMGFPTWPDTWSSGS